MSILVDKLRAVLFSNLREDMPKTIREGAWELFNSIDQDLDVAGYTGNESSSTQEVAEKFDNILRSLDSTEDFEFVEEEDTAEDTPANSILDTDISDDDEP